MKTPIVPVCHFNRRVGKTAYLSEIFWIALKGNYVGLLQEKCQKNHKPLPVYEDQEDSGLPDSVKKCLCKLDSWTTEGTGFNKKEARHNSAKLMLDIVTTTWSATPIPEKDSNIKSAVSKICLYCDLEKKQKPLFSEMEMEENLFVMKCTFNGYSVVGKGINKKEAKEKAAEEVVTHFGIHTFIDDYSAKSKRCQEMKNPVSKLSELCQSRKLSPCFSENIVTGGVQGKTVFYVVTCTVNELVIKSNPNCSKKSAKTEAAALMLDKLNNLSHLDSPNLTNTYSSHSSPQQSDCKVSSPEPKIDSSCKAKTKSHNVSKKMSKAKHDSASNTVQELSFNDPQTLSTEGEEYSGEEYVNNEESGSFGSDNEVEEEADEDDESSNGNVDLPNFPISENEESKSSDDGEPSRKRFKDVY